MKSCVLTGIICLPLWLFAQDSTENKTAWSFSGYLKDIAWVRFDRNFANAGVTNLVHNRMNIGWKPSDVWSGRLEIRNRLYWGDDVHRVIGFRQLMRNRNEAADLSATWLATRSAILHSNTERLWLEYKKPKWNIRAGRQRVNWGLANTWNPNDLFNSYNFLDFDYEERLGSDAVKTQYTVSDLSTIEISAARTGQQSIMAAKYFTNFHKYDLQWNTGVYQNTFTAGLGWAGSINEMGFKGEAQFYAGHKEGLSKLLLVLEADYIFKNGLYLSSAFLYDQKGLRRPLDSLLNLSFSASPRNLMPTKWNLLINASRDITPLFKASMNVVYAPGTNLVIIFPMLRYNLKTNWDLDLVWQSFFAETTKFQALSQTGYLRLRWSY